MSRVRRYARAFTLLELMCMLSAASIVLFVLGKLLLDGVYLQRIAAERANRLAVIDAMMVRLRADAIGATAYVWDESETDPTLTLSTCRVDGRHQVDWVFRCDNVLRRLDGCDAGGFRSARVQFALQIERRGRFDILVIRVIVHPPARARSNWPRTFSEHVLLPRNAHSSAKTVPEQDP